MRIAILSTWHRRCGVGYFYRRAFRQLGHDVVGIGSWKADEPYGTRGREPEVQIGGGPVFGYAEIAPVLYYPERADLLVIADGGEGLQVTGVPDDVRLVHLSSEGVGWRDAQTPHRYANIMRADMDGSVAWLPNAFDLLEHPPRTMPVMHIGERELSDGDGREYDLVQLASSRDARRFIWDRVLRTAPDLHCLFGDIWGPSYAAAYQHALATFTCSTQDFVTTRVFEAMACGCVVIADRTKAMASLFTEDEHFIGYDRVDGPGGEGMPDPDWLIETVRQIRRDGDGGMAKRVYALVASRDSYAHRAQRILDDVFGKATT